MPSHPAVLWTLGIRVQVLALEPQMLLLTVSPLLTPHINFVFISGLSFSSFKLYLNLLVFLVFVYVWEGGMSEWVGARATVPKWSSENNLWE